jgi:hypothetical protein
MLTTAELKEIAENFTLSRHASERIAERHSDIDIRQSILNPVLAYYNTDKSVNIAINEYEYLVVAPYTYKVITFKEKSHNNINIFAKRELAKQGKKRYVM